MFIIFLDDPIGVPTSMTIHDPLHTKSLCLSLIHWKKMIPKRPRNEAAMVK